MDNWKSIRLELARTSEFPGGSVGRAYLIRLPLNDSDRVDRPTLLASPHRATVRRHWATEADESGLISQVKDGWAMLCDGKPERLLRLDELPVRLGQQVSVVEADGSVLPFRVASIR